MCLNAYMYTCMCMCMSMYVCIYIMHIYIYMCIYTCISVQPHAYGLTLQVLSQAVDGQNLAPPHMLT